MINHLYTQCHKIRWQIWVISGHSTTVAIVSRLLTIIKSVFLYKHYPAEKKYELFVTEIIFCSYKTHLKNVGFHSPGQSMLSSRLTCNPYGAVLVNLSMMLTQGAKHISYS